MKREVCPICGSSDKTGLFERDFSGMCEITPFMHYEVFNCNNCGAVYAGEIQESMPLDRYYRLCSKYSNKEYNLSSSSRRRFLNITGLFEELIPKDASILDIGCAEGFLLDMLRNHGYEKVYGIEPSKDCVNYARDNLHINVTFGGLSDMDGLGSNRYDVIILEQVLEHIMSPENAIREMLKFLKDDGILCIGVPDLDSFVDQTDFYRQFSTEHINYFSVCSLKNLMKRHGLRKLISKRDTEEDTFVSFWQRTDDADLTLEFDYSGSDAIKAYIRQNEELTKSLKKRTDKQGNVLSSRGGRFNVWGSGTYLATLIQTGIINSSNIISVIDKNRNYQGHRIYDAEIIAPSDIDNDDPILIAVYGNSAVSVKNDIRQLKISNDILEV